MQEFEPKKKNKIVTKEFLAKNAYIFVIAIVLIVGISYGYTFFIQNKKIASGSITTAALTINFSDRSISASNLSVPNDDQEGMTEYSKSLTITNQTAIDGRVKLTLTRTSGLALTDMRYALIVNGAIQEIDDVPANGEILETAIMGGSPTGETINVELKLWPKSTYSGSTTTFVGELTPEIKYLGPVAADVSNLTGKYVEFNCNGSTCEEWQIVKVEDDRLVLTKSTNYPVSGTVTNSNRFNPVNAFNDDSLITSLSTDGDSVYLAKTVKIVSGSGTQADPYVLGNTINREEDKKVLAVITYKQNTTTLGTQNVYYNETNYISRVAPSTYVGWSDGTNHYDVGDTITTITTDTDLTAFKVQAVNLSFDNTTTSFNCTDAQCALVNLNDLIDPPTGAQLISRISSLETTPYGKVYTGADPDNYVWFNNQQWRILGVYTDATNGDMLKIIKATPYTTSQQYNSSQSSNAWSGSTIQTYLYNNYNSIISDATSREMIFESGSWNVGGCDYSISASAAYTSATGTTWTGKIGLIASYEYQYAATNDGCWTTAGNSYNGGCAAKDWLWATVTNNKASTAWLLSPQSSGGFALKVLSSNGYVRSDSVPTTNAASPVVFLKSTITITGGNGKSGEGNSYKLG